MLLFLFLYKYLSKLCLRNCALLSVLGGGYFVLATRKVIKTDFGNRKVGSLLKFCLSMGSEAFGTGLQKEFGKV